MGSVYQKQSHVATQETVKEDGDRTQIKITEVLGVCSCCLKPSGYMLARGPQLTGDAISVVLWGLDKGPNQMNMKF